MDVKVILIDILVRSYGIAYRFLCTPTFKGKSVMPCRIFYYKYILKNIMRKLYLNNKIFDFLVAIFISKLYTPLPRLFIIIKKNFKDNNFRLNLHSVTNLII